MTIATSQSQQTFLGNGVTTSFTFSFVGDSSSYISVYYTDTAGLTTLLSPSLYTLFLNAPSAGEIWGIGGSVVYPLSGPAIANGTSLTIARSLPLQQVVSIANQGSFAPEVIEEMGDTLEMQIQQISARTGQLRGTWASGVFYNYADIVIDGVNGANTGNYYMCAMANTSSVWATDLADGDWSLAFSSTLPIATLPLSPSNGGTGSSFVRFTGPTTTVKAFTLPNADSTIVVQGGALGTPSSGALANCTGLPVSTGISGLGAGVGAWLATPSSANLAAALTDETGTGPAVFQTAPTINQANLVGTTTNNNAAAGSVGEYIKASASAVSLSSGSASNITSILLSAGDWDVRGQIAFVTSASTSITQLNGGISRTSATLPGTVTDDTQSSFELNTAAFVPGTVTQTLPLASCRMSLSTTTTQVFLVAQANFTVSTLSGYGLVAARRIR